MNNLNLIVTAIGGVMLLIALIILIVNMSKGTFKINLSTGSLLSLSVVTLIAGFVLKGPVVGEVGLMKEDTNKSHSTSNEPISGGTSHSGLTNSTSTVDESNQGISDSHQLNLATVAGEKVSSISDENSVKALNQKDKVKVEPVTFTEEDLIGAWHWNDGENFYMILRKDGTYSYIEQSAGFHTAGLYSVTVEGDQFEVTVKHITGEYNNQMLIQVMNQDLLKVSEDSYSWSAERMNLAEAENILKSID
nr:hypothetical protein [Lysinibacillus timonensis]